MVAKQRAGKYDAVLPALPALPPENPTYQARVQALKDTVRKVACPSCGDQQVVWGETEERVCGACGGEATPIPIDEPPSAAELVAAYAGRRDEQEQVAATVSRLNLEIEMLSQLIQSSQERKAEGWGDYGVQGNALRLANGDTIRVRKEPYGQVTDKEAFRRWCVAPPDACMDCGEGEAAPGHDVSVDGAHPFHPGGGMERQLQLWPSTMNAVVKERLIAGDPLPDGTTAWAKTKIVFTPSGSVYTGD